MTAVAIALIALVVMEPVTALLHRHVFHGFAMGWHRSHHEPPHGSFEANDLFPLVFATATILVMSIGVWVGGGSVLVPLGVGVTAYGAAYLVVHDVVIHRRLPWLPIPDRVGARVRAAHNVHHLYGGGTVRLPRTGGAARPCRAGRGPRRRPHAPPDAVQVRDRIRFRGRHPNRRVVNARPHYRPSRPRPTTNAFRAVGTWARLENTSPSAPSMRSRISL